MCLTLQYKKGSNRKAKCAIKVFLVLEVLINIELLLTTKALNATTEKISKESHTTHFRIV